MIEKFPKQEAEHRVRTTTYQVTPVFTDSEKEDLVAKIKRLIMAEKLYEKKMKNGLA